VLSSLLDRCRGAEEREDDEEGEELVTRRRWELVLYDGLHEKTAALALPALGGGGLHRPPADVLEYLGEELAGQGGALHVHVRAHLLGCLVAFLWVDDAVRVGLGAEVALEAEDEEGEGLRVEGLADLFDPLWYWELGVMDGG